MKPRLFHHLLPLAGLLCLAAPGNALAHAPFDASARVIVHEDSAEVVVTVGSTLGEQYLRLAGINPGSLPQGHPVPLNPLMVTNFFTLAANEKSISPTEADTVTDGLEFQFHFTYPLEPVTSLRLDSFFLPNLKSPRVAPLVITDENGNQLGSAILSSEKTSLEVSLPLTLFPQTTNQTALTPTANLAPEPKANTLVGNDTPRLPAPSFSQFLKLGITHILTGYDHLLFLFALLLTCNRVKPMLLVITGFTLAHSLTLALAALNVVTISSRIIEPAIAATILIVGAENFRRAAMSFPRYLMASAFGLVHGFGFASALRETTLATHGAELGKPLLAFNLGVEIGQLAVAAVLLPILLALNHQSWFKRFGVRVLSIIIMLLAAWWLVTRILDGT